MIIWMKKCLYCTGTETPVDQSLWLFTQTTICCHLLFAIKRVTLLSQQFWASCRVLCPLCNANSRNSILYTHSLTHKHRHTYTLVHRQVPRCSFDAPPAKWSCCFLAPVTVETADCIISARQRGTVRWKRETISPSFHLLSSVMAVPLFLLSSSPPSVPCNSAFYLHIAAIPFHQKP